MCNHTETNEPLVIYKSLSFGSQYARPFSEWNDQVDTQDYGVEETPIFRFKKIEQ
jgi:hypothetical protein